MEAQKQTKIKQQPIKHKADSDIIVEVFNNMDNVFMSKIYLEFEKTNSVGDIFEKAVLDDKKANLHLNKNLLLTAPTQKAGFRVPKTLLCLTEH